MASPGNSDKTGHRLPAAGQLLHLGGGLRAASQKLARPAATHPLGGGVGPPAPARCLPPRPASGSPTTTTTGPPEQTEWATDLAFRDADTLGPKVYPQLIRRGIETFRSEDVLRFLGHRRDGSGGTSRRTARTRSPATWKTSPRGGCGSSTAPGGNHGSNSTNKQGSVLRVGNDAQRDQGSQGANRARPSDRPRWPAPLAGRMRRREWPERMARSCRAVSAASNDRYLEALGTLPTGTPVGAARAGKLCRSVLVAGRRRFSRP